METLYLEVLEDTDDSVIEFQVRCHSESVLFCLSESLSDVCSDGQSLADSSLLFVVDSLHINRSISCDEFKYTRQKHFPKIKVLNRSSILKFRSGSELLMKKRSAMTQTRARTTSTSTLRAEDCLPEARRTAKELIDQYTSSLQCVHNPPEDNEAFSPYTIDAVPVKYQETELSSQPPKDDTKNDNYLNCPEITNERKEDRESVDQKKCSDFVPKINTKHRKRSPKINNALAKTRGADVGSETLTFTSPEVTRPDVNDATSRKTENATKNPTVTASPNAGHENTKRGALSPNPNKKIKNIGFGSKLNKELPKKIDISTAIRKPTDEESQDTIRPEDSSTADTVKPSKIHESVTFIYPCYANNGPLEKRKSSCMCRNHTKTTDNGYREDTMKHEDKSVEMNIYVGSKRNEPTTKETNTNTSPHELVKRYQNVSFPGSSRASSVSCCICGKSVEIDFDELRFTPEPMFTTSDPYPEMEMGTSGSRPVTPIRCPARQYTSELRDAMPVPAQEPTPVYEPITPGRPCPGSSMYMPPREPMYATSDRYPEMGTPGSRPITPIRCPGRQYGSEPRAAMQVPAQEPTPLYEPITPGRPCPGSSMYMPPREPMYATSDRYPEMEMGTPGSRPITPIRCQGRQYGSEPRPAMQVPAQEPTPVYEPITPGRPCPGSSMYMPPREPMYATSDRYPEMEMGTPGSRAITPIRCPGRQYASEPRAAMPVPAQEPRPVHEPLSPEWVCPGSPMYMPPREPMYATSDRYPEMEMGTPGSRPVIPCPGQQYASEPRAAMPVPVQEPRPVHEPLSPEWVSPGSPMYMPPREPMYATYDRYPEMEMASPGSRPVTPCPGQQYASEPLSPAMHTQNGVPLRSYCQREMVPCPAIAMDTPGPRPEMPATTPRPKTVTLVPATEPQAAMPMTMHTELRESMSAENVTSSPKPTPETHKPNELLPGSDPRSERDIDSEKAMATSSPRPLTSETPTSEPQATMPMPTPEPSPVENTTSSQETTTAAMHVSTSLPPATEPIPTPTSQPHPETVQTATVNPISETRVAMPTAAPETRPIEKPTNEGFKLHSNGTGSDKSWNKTVTLSEASTGIKSNQISRDELKLTVRGSNERNFFGSKTVDGNEPADTRFDDHSSGGSTVPCLCPRCTATPEMLSKGTGPDLSITIMPKTGPERPKFSGIKLQSIGTGSGKLWRTTSKPGDSAAPKTKEISKDEQRSPCCPCPQPTKPNGRKYNTLLPLPKARWSFLTCIKTEKNGREPDAYTVTGDNEQSKQENNCCPKPCCQDNGGLEVNNLSNPCCTKSSHEEEDHPQSYGYDMQEENDLTTKPCYPSNCPSFAGSSPNDYVKNKPNKTCSVKPCPAKDAQKNYQTTTRYPNSERHTVSQTESLCEICGQELISSTTCICKKELAGQEVKNDVTTKPCYPSNCPSFAGSTASDYAKNKQIKTSSLKPCPAREVQKNNQTTTRYPSSVRHTGSQTELCCKTCGQELINSALCRCRQELASHSQNFSNDRQVKKDVTTKPCFPSNCPSLGSIASDYIKNKQIKISSAKPCPAKDAHKNYQTTTRNPSSERHTKSQTEVCCTSCGQEIINSAKSPSTDRQMKNDVTTLPCYPSNCPSFAGSIPSVKSKQFKTSSVKPCPAKDAQKNYQTTTRYPSSERHTKSQTEVCCKTCGQEIINSAKSPSNCPSFAGSIPSVKSKQFKTSSTKPCPAKDAQKYNQTASRFPSRIRQIKSQIEVFCKKCGQEYISSPWCKCTKEQTNQLQSPSTNIQVKNNLTPKPCYPSNCARLAESVPSDYRKNNQIKTCPAKPCSSKDAQKNNQSTTRYPSTDRQTRSQIEYICKKCGQENKNTTWFKTKKTHSSNAIGREIFNNDIRQISSARFSSSTISASKRPPNNNLCYCPDNPSPDKRTVSSGTRVRSSQCSQKSSSGIRSKASSELYLRKRREPSSTKFQNGAYAQTDFLWTGPPPQQQPPPPCPGKIARSLKRLQQLTTGGPCICPPDKAGESDLKEMATKLKQLKATRGYAAVKRRFCRPEPCPAISPMHSNLIQPLASRSQQTKITTSKTNEMIVSTPVKLKSGSYKGSQTGVISLEQYEMNKTKKKKTKGLGTDFSIPIEAQSGKRGKKGKKGFAKSKPIPSCKQSCCKCKGTSHVCECKKSSKNNTCECKKSSKNNTCECKKSSKNTCECKKSSKNHICECRGKAGNSCDCSTHSMEKHQGFKMEVKAKGALSPGLPRCCSINNWI